MERMEAKIRRVHTKVLKELDGDLVTDEALAEVAEKARKLAEKCAAEMEAAEMEKSEASGAVGITSDSFDMMVAKRIADRVAAAMDNHNDTTAMDNNSRY